MWKLGLIMIFVFTPLTAWVANNADDAMGMASAAMILVVGSILIMTELQSRDDLSSHVDLFLCGCLCVTFVLGGAGLIFWTPELGIRGTSISFGWVMVAFGIFGGYHRFRFSPEQKKRLRRKQRK